MTTPQIIKTVSSETSINIIKSVLGNIPVAGNLISLYLFDIGEKLKMKRLEKLLEEIKIRLDSLENAEFKNTDNKYDIIFTSLLAATKTESDRKIKKYADIITHTLRNDAPAEIEVELRIKFIKIIEDLSEYDMLLLDQINQSKRDPQTGFRKISIAIGDAKSVPLNDFKLFKISYFDLLSKGLLMQHNGPESLSATYVFEEGEINDYTAYLSYLGYSLIEFLKEVETTD